MAGTFDFAPNSHDAIELPPEEQSATSLNGWESTIRPAVPYRAKFQLTLNGMRWFLSPTGDRLDVGTDAPMNAGRLLNFYKLNRMWDTFLYKHEYLGQITCRFAEALQIPKALPSSQGLLPAFTVTLVHHNPSF